MSSWHDDAPTSPFVNKGKHCAFKSLVTLVYLYWYPVSSLRDRLNAACGQSLNSVVFLVILGLSLAFYSSCVCSFPFLLKGPSFTVSLSFWSMGLLSSGWWWFFFITGCCCTVSLLALNTNDWRHWIPLMVLVGALLALAMATA